VSEHGTLVSATDTLTADCFI